MLSNIVKGHPRLKGQFVCVRDECDALNMCDVDISTAAAIPIGLQLIRQYKKARKRERKKYDHLQSVHLETAKKILV